MRTPARGFTLIEVLVSIFLLGIVFVFCYGTLDFVVKSRASTQATFERTRNVQLALHLMVTDFEQLQPRPVREPLGGTYQPALRADARTDDLVALTRGGWSNTAGLQRGTLQRVNYRLLNGTLTREYTTALDPTLATPVVKRDILTDVVSLKFRFMDASRAWVEQWPPLVASGGANTVPLRTRPIAVEITIELKDFGRIVRLVEVPG